MAKKKTVATPSLDEADVPDVKFEGETRLVALSDLELDPTNPRLGAKSGHYRDQTAILDAIVSEFGVDNLLSSLAVNGYFEAEPLVGVRKANSNTICVVEGNRRLSACLILAGDLRAKNQSRRTSAFRQIQQDHQRPAIERVPVRIVVSGLDLTRYLGVRHIAGAERWDSYAKACWIAKVLEDGDLKLKEICEMIGDEHRTVARMLEGYYFVKQLVTENRFNPDSSMRTGRGSNPEFPFSWVYTTLGFKSVREWLGLPDRIEDQDFANKKVIREDSKLDDGGDLLELLFGNSVKGRQPALDDSRQIAELAKVIAIPECRRLMLRQKKSVQDVIDLRKPASDRMTDWLSDANEALSSAVQAVARGDLKPDAAKSLVDMGAGVRNLANKLYQELFELARGNGEV